MFIYPPKGQLKSYVYYLIFQKIEIEKFERKVFYVKHYNSFWIIGNTDVKIRSVKPKMSYQTCKNHLDVHINQL